MVNSFVNKYGILVLMYSISSYWNKDKIWDKDNKYDQTHFIASNACG